MKKIKIFIVCLICFVLILGCSKEDESVTFNFTYGFHPHTASDSESISAVVVYDENGNDIGGGAGMAKLTGIKVGEVKTVEVTVDREGVLMFSGSVKGGFKRVKTNKVVKNGDDVSWNTIQNIAYVSSAEISGGLAGTWIRVDGCSNSNGTKDSFTFSSGGTGNIFQVDCNGVCSTGGVRTNFNYSVSGSSVSITPTSVPQSCGVTTNVPAPFTLSWSISGDILTMDGVKWKRG